MGIVPAPKKCFITGFEATDRPTQWEVINYSISVLNNTYQLEFENYFEPSFNIKGNRHIFIGLIINGKLKTNKEFNNDILEKILQEADYPKTPKEKFDGILTFLSKISDYDGAEIELTDFDVREELLFYQLYLKNEKELLFYLETIKEKGFVQYDLIDTKSSYSFRDFHITFEGMNYLLELQKSPLNNNRCFVAMSFSKTMATTREAIKLACIQTGYIPVLIDEVHINSDETINDAIISELKNCKFCISDFSEQKDGVYFESGFALGRGVKVIYCCHKDWFEKSHFDTNHFPHLIYSSGDELKDALVNKINAWIKS